MIANPPSYLMLMVTTACNLSCAYCYEGETHAGKVMHLDTAMKALHVAAASGRAFHVQITGGEPLLAAEQVFTILEQIQRERLPATTALQTNGVLLDRETARELKRYRTGIGISIDGSPHVQEALRGGSRETYRALTMLEKERIPFRVTAVLTDRNVRELRGLLMALYPFSSARGFGLDLLVQKGAAAEKRCHLPRKQVLAAETFRLLETLDLFNRRRKRPLEFRERALVLRSWRQGSSRAYCSACSGASLAVTPDGKLYPCTQAVGDPALFLGTVDSPSSAYPALSESTLFSEACTDCPLEGRCPGECPTRLLYNGDVGRELICELYRTIFQYCVQQGDIAV